jgi:HEAT repeat protein
MTSLETLLVVAIGQGALLAALFVLIVYTRWYAQRRAARIQPARAALDRAMQRWAMGPAGENEVVAALARLPPVVATDALATWSSRASGERWDALARRLAGAPWTRTLRRYAKSRRWWHRLDAARFFAAVATPADAPAILGLLADEHPAVRLATVPAVARLEDPALLEAELDRLPTLTPTVVGYHAGLLRRARDALIPLLLARLRADQPGLAHYAEFAARLGEPALRPALTALAGHGEVEVRIQVARALGGYPHGESQAALVALATDPAWQVRAQAMRSLGRLADRASLTLLGAAVEDPEWWVRLRAALALTRLGPAGLDVLFQAERSAAAGARDMARLILGLPPQALAEFSA